MLISEEFEQALHEALSHLYDPDYRPSEPFCRLVGCDPPGGALAVQTAISHAIERLEPERGTPSTAQTRRLYDVLHSRFILRLTQEETAESMHVSLSSIQRAQREAIHTLARVLWERRQTEQSPGEDHSEDDAAAHAKASGWRAQVRQELASLQSRDPDRVTAVAQALQDVLELEDALALNPGVHIEVAYVQPNLVAAVHPSVLRQMLIAALGRVAQHAVPGTITAYARLAEGNVRITIRRTITDKDPLTEVELMNGVLVPEGTTVEGRIRGSHAFLWITVPSLGQISVLAVDDNPDMVHFYRRCTTGTRYHIIHASEGREALQMIKTSPSPPDIIVLDVMLPDMDGWKLLMQLHEDPATRSTPVIVCSVVREESLARSLGAAFYLTKPVEPRQFVQALNQVRPQASARALQEPVNTSTTD